MDMPYWFDGNNLTGQSAAAARADPRVRREFLSALCACHRSGGGRFLVYFDGDSAGSGAPPPGVPVRYSAPLSTDDAILKRLREVRNPSEVVVVTNDRELTSRCRNAGAGTLNWREFDARMRSRSARRAPRVVPQDTVDVDDWLHYFGMDKSKS